MNILHTGDKLSVQRGLLKKRFLGRLYNFCNFVIMFNVSHDDMLKSNVFCKFVNDRILPKNVRLIKQVYRN